MKTHLLLITFGILLLTNLDVNAKKMRFCTSCGYEMSSFDWICSECGSKPDRTRRYGSAANGVYEAMLERDKAMLERDKLEESKNRHKRELAHERRMKRMELKQREEEAEKQRELEKELFEAELKFKQEQEEKRERELKKLQKERELEARRIRKEEILEKVENLKKELFICNQQLLESLNKDNNKLSAEAETIQSNKTVIVQDAFNFYYDNITSLLRKPYSNPTQKVIDCYINLIYAEALLRLLPSNDKENIEKYKKILNLKKRCLNVVPSESSNECPKCNSDGFIDYKYMKLDNMIGIKENSLPCPLCKQNKTISFVLSREEIEYLYLKSLIEHQRQIISNNKMLFFFKNQFIDKLSTQEKISYARLSALPCENCFGFKIEQCKNCVGFGHTKCSIDSCNDGYKKNDDNALINSIQMLQRCSNCDGIAYLECESCKGHGYISCSLCNGTGKKKKCDNCRGQGYFKCTICISINNKNDNKCISCNNDGIVLCKTCDGAGVK